ncbi:LTA synthase family protein [Lentilactobacillus sp. G22-6]|uniref:LTA synthase family protein n=1 Tax=Lentilactobacillus dabitei TaxID=2831523 RepID=UPI001C262F7E|nr:LTA synthase family protein [Lentilactobacillus dabitei]MBU9789996.1 LTA synthase family protein [Lentilactobacillus dabitei]
MKFVNKILEKSSTRKGFLILLVVCFWLKTMLAYFADFKLGIGNPFQFLIVLINPLATTGLLIGIALYFKRARFFYPIALLISILDTVLLYLNVIYFREFTDFMTVSTMTGYSKVNQGLSGSSWALTNIHDIFYWIDIVIIVLLLVFKKIKIDQRPLNRRIGLAVTSFCMLFFTINLSLAEMDRPQLLTRTFDRTYIVKYLGLDAFTVYDGMKSQHNNDLRATATKSELDDVLKFTRAHYAKPNKKYYGIAKGKNVIYIHLESFQQFLIGQKINGKEVTPFLNKLYRSHSSYAFKNFFHQVGQGKTSDAENMLETSTYGLPQGSLFAQLGSDNTFQAAPAILKQRRDYTSAVFHGNIASFWNRNNVYKNMGYQYFFDASYYDTSGDRSLGYGLKDKLLFRDSVQYLQNLQQPFYVKYLTVTNHFPFDLDKEDTNFKTTNTGDDVVDNYFLTAHYLDQAVHEFYNYLRKSGLLKHSVIVLYGDHYGISDSENQNLAKAIHRNANDWDDFDNAQLQRVPLIINIPGRKDGYVSNKYAGEIDVLPTLMHLLGVSTKRYVQFGTDIFSKQHDQVVAFRNQDWVSPTFTSIGGDIYSNKTGQLLKLTKQQAAQVKKNKKRVQTELSLSDSLNEKNLLRFYHPKGFESIDPRKYNYADGYQKEKKIEEKRGKKSTSLYSENGDKSTIHEYFTDAPEIHHKSSDTNRIKITNPDATNNDSSR